MFGFAKKLVKQAEGIIAPEIDSSSPTHGFRILHVEPDSEAFHAGLEPLFDFIIAANGVPFNKVHHGQSTNRSGHISVEQEQSPMGDFSLVVQNTEARLVLEIWCAKGRSTRIVTLPNPAKHATGLGLTLQWSSLSVADHVWHILNVVPSSPADAAGLVSHADYIVAGENGILEEGGEYLLGRAISRANPTEGILFYVYNREFDLVRPVRVFPSRDGKLGCGVGYGLLHALPKVSKSNSRATPGSLVFDEQEINATYLDSSITAKVPAPQPAPIPSIPVGSAPSTSVSSPSRGHHYHYHKPDPSAAVGLDDYFEEQSQLSRQIDGSSSEKTNKIPPPPKAPST